MGTRAIRAAAAGLHLVAACLAAGCAQPYRHSLVEEVAVRGGAEQVVARSWGRTTKLPEDLPELPAATFPGFLTTSKAKSAGVLIAVHGMCSHARSWFEELTCQIGGAMDLPAPAVKQIPLDGSGVELYVADLEHGGTPLRAYGIVYSPVIDQAKQSLCAADVDKGAHDWSWFAFGEPACAAQQLTYNRARTFAASRAKSGLMNSCLADAVAYLGPSGEQVRRGVATALRVISTDLRQADRFTDPAVSVLTVSLGSKVLSDVLLCETAEKGAKAFDDAVLRPEHVELVYMQANQIPLLNLGFNLPACATPGTKPRTLPELLGPKAVVAFTDPSDLLSYEVTPADVGGGNTQVFNAIVSNVPSPQSPGLLAPALTHGLYANNPEVIGMLLCGRDEKGIRECITPRSVLATGYNRHQCRR